MAEIIKFETKTRIQAKPHDVFARTRWSDAWVKIPWLFADQVTWAAAPTIPTAQLHWDYGRLARQGETALHPVSRLAGFHRWWVKIVAAVNKQKVGSDEIENPLVWYGSLELSLEQLGGVKRITHGGATTDLRTGAQEVTAYGLAWTLDRTWLRHSVWRESPGIDRRIERPIAFNATDAQGRITGNRSSSRSSGGPYRFTDQLRTDDKFWSTRDIAEYLCEQGAPIDREDGHKIKLLLDPDTLSVLPDWDKRHIAPGPRDSIWALLNESIPRGRLLGFYLDVSGLNEDWTVFPFSQLGTALTLADVDGPGTSGTIPANARQRILHADTTVHVHLAVKESTLQVIDRVRCRGGRRTSTFTISEPDETLEIGFSGLKTEYEDGASGAASFGGLTLDEKRKANAEARAADKLFAAYRYLRIPSSWADGRGANLIVRNGLGADGYWLVFPQEGEERTTVTPTLAVTKGFPVYPRELFLLRTLPLKEGYDYRLLSSPGSPDFRLAPTKVSDGPFHPLPPLCLFRVPETTATASADADRRWVHGEQIGRAAEAERKSSAQNRRLTVRLQVAQDDRGLLLEVSGAPQHAIFDEFTGQSGIDQDIYGEWDWKQAVYTVAAYDDRYCEGVWPEKTALDVNLDSVRELIVDFGDAYRLDWLVKNTVIGVDPATGMLSRCSDGGWINDDRPQLLARAKVMHAYYKILRRALEVQTTWVNSAISLGDYIVKTGELDERTIDSVVTEITLTIPGGQDPGEPVIHYSTAYVEREALRSALA